MLYVGTRPGHTSGHNTLAPGEESWGRWAGTLGNSDKALVIHGNVTRNTEYVFLCLGIADTDR